MDEQGIEYKYFKFVDSYQKNNLKDINDLLQRGWYPVRECAFGGYSGSSVLILMMRTIKKSDVVMTEIADELDAEDCGQDRQEPPQAEGTPGLCPQEPDLPEL